MRAPLLALLLVSLPLAGCLGDDAPPATQSDLAVAATATEAGAVEGETPSGAKAPFRATAASGAEGGDRQELVAHPFALRTNPAKPPVLIEVPGTFNQTDCKGVGLNLGAVSMTNSKLLDLSPHLAAGDVFEYAIRLTYEARSDAPAELHLLYGIGNKVIGHNEPIGEKTGPIDQNFTGQSYRVSDDDMAWVRVNCWWGGNMQPIPYTLTVELSFAEAAIPAESPFLVTVPEGATRLIVRGVAVDPSRGVNSHFRLFGPDDELVCECGLGGLDEASYIDVPAPGDYVLLVDHTANGFVSLALDAPPTTEIRPLAADWVLHKVFTSSGESAVDETIDLPLERVPLLMHAFTTTEGMQNGVGMGKTAMIEVTNPRGAPLRIGWGGWVAQTVQVPGAIGWQQWWGMGLSPTEWFYEADHHAYDVGAHQVHFKAESFRGDVYVLTREYQR